MRSYRDLEKVYGGVATDVNFVFTNPHPLNVSAGSGHEAIVMLLFLPAEFAATFVADTATLPLVLGIYQLRKYFTDSENSDQPPAQVLEPSDVSPVR